MILKNPKSENLLKLRAFSAIWGVLGCLPENSSSDANVSGEWTLLVDVSSFDGGLWGLESHTDISVVSVGLLNLLGKEVLGVQEHGWLSLESSFSLLNLLGFWTF